MQHNKFYIKPQDHVFGVLKCRGGFGGGGGGDGRFFSQGFDPLPTQRVPPLYFALF